MEYEFGVIHYRDVCLNMENILTEDLHRSGLTSEEADEWLTQWKEDGGSDGAYLKVKRPVGQWKLDNVQPK